MEGRLHKFMLYLAIAAWFHPIALAQAPGDTADTTCMISNDKSSQVTLLNSYYYDSLLSSTTKGSLNAGWTQTPADKWTEEGSYCAKRLTTSCSQNPAGNNWVVTQYILRSSNVSYPMRITVNISAETTYACSQSQSCSSGRMGVYYYPSSGPVVLGQQLVTGNFKLIETTTLPYITTSYSFSFSLDAVYDRFYIAVVEQNYCITLRNLVVFYSTCPAETVNFVIYPTTPVGSDGVLTTASCTQGMSVSPESSLSITCNMNGTYSDSPDCSSCAGGYFKSGKQCFACAAGSFPDTSTSCAPCPANSASDKPATAVCPCNEGYFRAPMDPASQACGVGPGPASGLRVTSVRGTNVDLEWEAAVMTGGRTDIFYRIGYRTKAEDSYTYFDPPSRITGTSGTLSSLSARTTYSVVVVTENGVSFDRPSTFPDSERMSNEVMVTTQSGGSTNTGSNGGSTNIGSLWVTAITAVLAVAFLLRG